MSFTKPPTYALIGIFLYLNTGLKAQNELEPNGSIATANPIAEGTSIQGTQSASDVNDYFLGVPSDDGKVQLNFSYSNTGTGPGNLFVYIYNKNGALIGNRYLYGITAGSSANDSAVAHCRSSDTIYFRINATENFSYSLVFNTESFGMSDSEPNDAFASSQLVNQGDSVPGRIGYASIGSDANDYFVSLLPTFGTFKLDFWYRNTGSGNGNFFVYVYNKNGSLIGSNFLYAISPDTLFQDSILIHCRELDSVYFRISSNGCFSYHYKYEVIAPTQNDQEPNDNFSSAVLFNPTDSVEGRIGYQSTTTDLDDYFYSVLPDDGTLEYYVWRNKAQPGNGNFFSYIYNKSNGLIGNNYVYSITNTNGYDTIRVPCRAADTVYFRISSTGCFNYRFHYRLIPSGISDNEPNDMATNANFLNNGDTAKGRIGYTSISTDANDYFMSVLPDDGTIRCYIKRTKTQAGNANFFSYVYNKSLGLIGSNFKYAISDSVGTDTIEVNCRAADTVFFRISSNGCFSYELSYELIPSGINDQEPNNQFTEAQAIQIGDTIDGRINHGSIQFDANDYFYTVLPAEGNIRYYVWRTKTNPASSNFFSYVYNENQGLIGSSFQYGITEANEVDTILVNCSAADTVYFRISSANCFSYRFLVEIDSAGMADHEPNNSITEAPLIQLDGQVSGRIGHSGTTTDALDIYKLFIPGYADLNIQLNLNNTSGSNFSDFYVSLLNSSGGVIQTSSYLDQPIGQMLDTVNFTCLPRDTFYLRIQSAGCFSYDMNFDVIDQQPLSQISFGRYGNNVGFASTTTNADSLYWDFDDGSGTSKAFPEKSFAIGVYDVTLSAYNSKCGIADVDTARLIVAGIESYTPKEAATDTLVGYFLIRVFGGGLDTAAIVSLDNGGLSFSPEIIRSPDPSEMTVLFNFKDVEFGTYDLNIKLSNGDEFNFPEGFTISKDEPGIDLDASVTGPNRIRTNRWTDFTLNVANNRKKMANGVFACLVVPPGVETNIHEVLEKQTGSITLKDELWDELTIDRESFSEFYFQGNFDPSTDTVHVNFDSLCADMESVVSVQLDSLFNEPITGNLYPIYLPIIAGESTRKVHFKIRSTSNQTVDILSYTWVFTQRDNPWSPEALDYVHEGGMQAAALAEMAPNPALRAVGKSAGWVDIGSKIIFTEAFDWYYGVNNADAAFYAEQGLSATINYAASKNPYGSKYERAERKIAEAKFGLKRTQETHQLVLQSISKNRKVPKVYQQNLLDQLSRTQRELAMLDRRLSFAEKQRIINGLKSYASGRGISIGTNELNELLFGDEPKSNVPDRIDRNPITSITSFDPNEIYGTNGPTALNFVERDRTLHYQVSFENVDTAKAPAQIVRVEMTLDTNTMDLASFSLGDVGFGGNTYFFEDARRSYYRDIDLRPDKDMIVRVVAQLDTVTGALVWNFASLDPATDDLVSDPDDGFLPPNINFPEGEGYVTFSVKMKEGLTAKDTVKAFADIYFDENEPIQTSTWLNAIDDTPPTSSLLSYTVENDTLVRLSYAGSDGESGVSRFFLNVNRNGDGWLGDKGVMVPFSGEVEVTGIIGDVLEFIILSKDSVGNFESKPLTPELRIDLTPPQSEFASAFELYPNPSSGTVMIRSNGNFRNTSLEVSDISGKVVYKDNIDFYQVLDQEVVLHKLRSGTYFFNFEDRNGHISTQKLILLEPEN